MKIENSPNAEFDKAFALTVDNVETYREIFLESLSQDTPISIRLSEIDSVGLQLLVSLKKAVLARNGQISVSLESPDLMELITPSGLQHFLF